MAAEAEVRSASVVGTAGDACPAGDSHGYITFKDEYLGRLRRIEGQARGLQRMVDEDHIGHCVVNAAVCGGPEADAKVKEAADAIARLVRL